MPIERGKTGAGNDYAKNALITAMQELKTLIEKLLEEARNLPPGKERYDVLKEMGLLRLRLDELSKRLSRAERPCPHRTNQQK